ncbi:MAG: GGDEF domain-containing protein [Phycisphaeraceae bacterium]|nr:GGDEF domain-containing protein [Phycisphaeraceae bacterium]
MTIDVERLRAQLDATVRSGGVSAAFQPIVDLKCGEIAGFETLTRLSDGGAFKSPAELFDAAEKAGALWRIEEMTRRVSLAAASSWPSGSKLFLNTTPQVFADPRFCSELLKAVRATPGISPTRIVLEITERSAHQHDHSLDEQVRMVKAAGFEVAIDDVGAGTSGLNRIMALRPHWLKLDRELIENISHDRVRQNLIRFFLRFATLSGVKLIAEGIEREDELAMLMELGVVYGQGYLLGRPGDRNQELRSDIRGFIRSRRVGGLSGSHVDPRVTNISRYVRPVTTADSCRQVIDVSAEIMRNSSIEGVLVMEAGRPAGWCEREALLRCATEDKRGQRMESLMRPGMACADPETSIPDALVLAAGRDDRCVGLPLVVMKDQEVIGTLSIGDLMHAAAELSRETQLRIAPLTGLPGRVLADEHLRSVLGEKPVSLGEHRTPVAHDVAILNIRGFARYNEMMGYELGDELLKRVSSLFTTSVRARRPEIFFAHVGNDRFLATGKTGTLAAPIEHFLREFDEREAALSAARAGAMTPRLRVTLASGASRWLPGSQMLYRMSDQWQRQTGPEPGKSELVIVNEWTEASRLRASA